MAKHTERPSRSLGTRFFLATVVIVVLAVGVSVLLTFFLGNRIASRAVAEVLERSGAVQETVQEKTLDQLRLVARLFANDPPFAAYVATSILNNDQLSLNDQLEERRADLAFDLAIVLDPDGVVFARTDDPEPSRDDFSGEPLVVEALSELEAYGTWDSRGRLYYAAAVPIGPGDLLEGFLIAGAAIDDDAALELRQISGTEVAFVLDTSDSPVIAASTLDDQQERFLQNLLERRESERADPERNSPQPLSYRMPGPMELGERRYLALVQPLAGVTEQVGSVISLASLDDQLEPFRQIQKTLLSVGVGAVLLAIGLSFLLRRRVSQPIEQLAAAAQAAAAGDYDQRIPAEGRDELGALAAAFSSLLSDLREKRDMEVYITELAKSVSEEEGTAAAPGEEMVPPEGREMALLGVELRGYSEQIAQAATPKEAIDRLAQGIRFVTRAISSHGGRVQAVVGHRVVASFPGNRRSERAMAAASAILAGVEDLRRTGTFSAFGTTAPAAQLTTALALVSGPLVSGSFIWDHRPENALAGPPVDELENLLRVARPGNLWLSQATKSELTELWATSGVEPRMHKSPLTPEPIYAVAEGDAGSFVQGELTDTQNLTTPMSTAPVAQTVSVLGPGSQLGDRFKILSQLGAGGMGVVYKARDASLNELVALKMLKAEVWNDSERLEGLKEELKLARKIAHPNVLRTYDFGELEGVPFISMEYVRGITLRKLLDQSGRLPLSAGLRLARQLCRGLEAAHGQGVLHRDIKPENLIVEHTGNVKLMDFGIAQRIERRTPQPGQDHQLVGTPYYLAPEQLQGREADERADLYATGVVLYELFTGKLPYPATGNVMQIVTLKLNEPPTPPRVHWEGMPESLERIILRCLEKKAESRYPDARTLVGELEVLRA